MIGGSDQEHPLIGTYGHTFDLSGIRHARTERLTGGGIPELDRLAESYRQKRFAAGTEGLRHAGSVERRQGRGLWRNHSPQPSRPIPAAREHGLAVGTESDGSKFLSVPRGSAEGLTSSHLPQPGGSVRASGHEG